MKTEFLPQKINLKESTSIQIGPTVPYLEIRDKKELLEISKIAKKDKKKVHVLGDGTNCYFSENKKLEKKYLFIKLNLPEGTLYTPNPVDKDIIFVTAPANLNWNSLVQNTVEKNLWGLENLSLIPGTVGAAPVQNIGAYGTDISKTFFSAEVFDLKKNKFLILKNKDCEYSYRNSIFKKNKNRYIILSVTFKLSQKRNPILTYSPLNKLDKEKISLREIANSVINTRTEKLPDYNIFPNSGSFFKNPKISFSQLKILQKKFPNLVFFEELQKKKKIFKIAIAWFIENVIKMKGVQVGNFGTAKTHSLVIVNYEGLGNAKELNNYIKLLTKKIKKETGLKLEQEVNFIE
jgi:UDP-N-acetylmuramate dehydrogenase